MKYFLKCAVAACIIVISMYAPNALAQSVGINYTASSANPSALLDVGKALVSGNGDDTKGMLIPRVQLVASNNTAPILPAPGVNEKGLIVYNTATAGSSPNNVVPGYYYWDGTKWISLGGGNGGLDWGLLGNSGTNAATNFLGTTDAVDLVFKTNNSEAMRILSNGWVGIGSNTATPTTVLVVSSDGNTGAAGSPSLIVRGTSNKERIQLESYSTPPGPIYNGVGAHVSGGGSPTQTLANDPLVGLGGRGFDNGSPTASMTGNMGLFQILAEENFTASAQGTYFSFSTTCLGCTTRTEKMRITSAGRLGIGATSPGVKLEVSGSDANNQVGAGVNAVLKVVNTDISTGGRLSEIHFGHTSANKFAAISGAISDASSNTRGDILFSTRNAPGDANLTERMRIDGAGNIGIGTSSPQGSIHISNATPRILLLDTDSPGLSAANPAWSVRGQNDGYFRIQSTVDYASYTNRFLIDASGNATINSLAGTGSSVVQADANGVLSRTSISGLVAPLIAGDMAHNFTPGTNNANHIAMVAMYAPSTGKVWIASTNYTTNIENMDITSGVGNEWNPDGSNNTVWVDFGDPNGAGTSYVVDIDVAVSGFENNDQTSAMIFLRMSNGDSYIRSTTSATVSGSSLDNTSNWGAWTLMPDPGE